MKGKHKLYYLQWDPALFKAETSHLTFVERSLYRCLIDDWWIRKSLPNDQVRLALIAQLEQSIFDEAWPEVSTFFYIKGDNNEILGHPYLERLYNICLDKSTTSSEAGKISGLVRKGVERPLNERSSFVERSLNHKDKDKDKETKREKTDFPKKTDQNTIGASPQTPPSASLQAHRKSKSKKTEINYTTIEGLNLEMWVEWIEYRKISKFKTYKTDAGARSLAKVSREVQEKTIRHSIENGYQGLFPEKFADNPSNGGGKKKTNGGDNVDYGSYGNPRGYATPPDASEVKKINDALVEKFRTMEGKKNPAPKKETKKSPVKPKVVDEKRALATEEEFEKEKARQLKAADEELARRSQ